MAAEWAPAAVVPVDLSDGAVEALACIYVGRLAGLEPGDVVLGDYEQAVVLVAQAEVACCQAAGDWPQLWFAGPPLRIGVEGQRLVRPPPQDRPFDQDT